MFDAVRNNKRFAQVFLALITLPFAFWGVESYIRDAGSGGDVATVGGAKISQQELQAAAREQQERLSAQFGGRIDPAMLDTPPMRKALLDNLITQKLVGLHVKNAHLTLTDGDLARIITGAPEFQQDGKFVKERYDAFVAAQGMSKEMFESRLRQNMAIQQLTLPVGDATITGQTAALRWLSTQLEQRDVAELKLSPEAYAGQVKLAADAVQKYYDGNKALFEIPEQVRAEYLVLNQDALAGQVTISEDEIKARYQAKTESTKEPETRRASHILLRVAKDAPEAEVKAAQAKANEILAQVRKSPSDFAKLAKQHSQDPGSAANGGDLDWFGRNMMVKPFEDAVFASKDGQIPDVVRSDFGFHIIRVTGVKAARTRSLDEMRGEIFAELKREAGSKKYAEVAEAFGNTVYEQSDSLKPAAEKWKLTPKQSDWLSNVAKGGGKLPAPFDHPKLAAALFGDDAIKNKRNTEAVEVTPGTMIAARVLEHKPATQKPFDSVKAEIEKRLIREEAIKLAVKDGEDKLARLTKGENVDLKWGTSRGVTRAPSQDRSQPALSPDALRAVFKADAAKLPAYAGVVSPRDGYVLYRIGSVKAGDVTVADTRAGQLRQNYARLVAEEDFGAWLATLREKYPVKIDTKLLEKKEQP